MCLSQPSSLYQRCFLFPLLKGPGFPAVFLENFPIFEGFLRAKCFPTVKGRAQGCKKKRKKSKIPETNPYPGEEHLPPNIANMHKTCYVFFSMVCARLNFLFYFILFFSPRRSRRGTLGISSPGGPVEEPLKPFCSFFSLRRLSSSVVFQWGYLRQTLDLSKTTNEKVPWRRSHKRSLKVYYIKSY